MTKRCALFPGQGSQSQGMALSFYDNFDYVRQLFEEASDVLGYSAYDIIKDNPDGRLNQTETTQPMLLLASAAAYEAAKREQGFNPDFAAGHSLGEYTALWAAGVMSFADAIRVVAQRGELMQQAVPEGEGAMAAIIGVDDDSLKQICSTITEGYVTCANFNSPGQIVVSGEKSGVEALVAVSKSLGAKIAKLLPVSVPSHCQLMESISERFAATLNEVAFNEPAFPIMDNVDANVHERADELKHLLIQQLYSPVLWRHSIENLVSQHECRTMFEFGPGKVLTGLNKRISKEIESASIVTTDDLEQLKG